MEAVYASFMVFADWFGSSRVRVTMPSASMSYLTALLSVIWGFLRWLGRSDELDDGGDAHAAADAERGEAAALALALQLVDERAQDDGAGGAQRVAHGDGAAVDVGDVVADPHVLHEAHRDGGEGLVDLPQVDVVSGQAGPG